MVLIDLIPGCRDGLDRFRVFLIVEHGHLIQAAVDGDVVPVAGLAVQSVDVLGDEVFVGEPFVHPVGPVMAVGRESVKPSPVRI